MLLERGLLHEEEMIRNLPYETVGHGPVEERFARTVELMRSGAERIYHGILMHDDMVGEPDLLERITTEIGLSEALDRAPEILAGKVRGRLVVDVNRK